jgi:transcriptional regulator with XRE-family HTH domain
VHDKLGKAIRILRQAKGLRIGDVAENAGISAPFLCLVENGERQPSLTVLQRLAAALGVPADALILIGMGGQQSLESSDHKTEKLTNAISDLMKSEEHLSQLLGKEGRRASAGDKSKAHRKRDGNKPK